MNEFLRANRGPVFSGTSSSGINSGTTASENAQNAQNDQKSAELEQQAQNEKNFATLLHEEIQDAVAF